MRKRKTEKEIIESATRPINDLNNRLTLEGFKNWFEYIYKNKMAEDICDWDSSLRGCYADTGCEVIRNPYEKSQG